jgi:diaminopimelate epimerase
VRTYERGVENETLACGTGSTASSIVSALQGYCKPPVQVKTSGGEILTVDFKLQGRNVSNVTLEGEVQIVYEGKLYA